MSLFEPARAPWPDRFLALLRIVAALIFITSGTMKIFGYPPSPVQIPPFNFFTQIGIGALLEVVGGALILIGFLTRPAAFILAGEMAVAYFQFHAPMSFWPTVNNGVAAVLYCFLFLYLMMAGPGAWSVDGSMARRRTT
jgi:putative oxidoreductase